MAVLLVKILIPIIFMIVVGVVIFIFVARGKGEVMEVRQDKTVWISLDPSRTRRYISGYVENEKEVNGRIVLLLRPTYIGLNEKVSNITPFAIAVTKSMIKRSTEGRNPVMFIEPHMGDGFPKAIKESKWYEDIVNTRTQTSMLEKENNILKKQLIQFTSKVPKAIREPYDNILSEKFKVKKSIDLVNSSIPQLGGVGGNPNIPKRY